MKLNNVRATEPGLLVGSSPRNPSTELILLIKIQNDWTKWKKSPLLAERNTSEQTEDEILRKENLNANNSYIYIT